MKAVFSRLKGDKIIWVITILLCIVSVLVVYSSTATLAYKQAAGNTFYYFNKQLMFVLIALAVMYAVHLVSYRYFEIFAGVLYLLSLGLLVYTLLRGSSINEATRWINIPGINISFQTSDYAKMALMMYLAVLLSKNRDDLKDFKGFLLLMIPVCLTCLLILPSNLSTAALLFVTSLVLMYVGRVKLKYIAATLGTGIAVLGIFILIAVNLPDTGRTGTWEKRITNYFSKEDHFQAEQSKIAIATGSFLGKGPGQSVQRNILPHPYSDFIFAVIVEEYGGLAGLLIMSFYLVFLYRGIEIVKRIPGTFPALLALGMILLIVIQAFTHIGVCTGLFPVTGQTLPLVSMGGTSLIITGMQLGMILSVSRSVTNNQSDDDLNDNPDKETDNEQNTELNNEKTT